MRNMLAIAAFSVSLGGQAIAQSDPSTHSSPQEPPATTLDDVIVASDPLEEVARDYVESLAAPARGRGLARWESEICLGVTNFDSEAAHQLLDHISRVASDHGIALGDPGCAPNVMIMGTSDGRALASALVDRRRREFRYGYTRSNRGSRALEVFRVSDSPIRWWHISLLYIAGTDTIAMRLPGEEPVWIPCPQRRGARYCNAVNDRIVRAWIIVDLEALPKLSFQQFGDYLSMVTLAQVEPETDYSNFDTVLNVLNDPGRVTGLTEWDRAYLRALYSGESERLDPGEQAEALADELRRTRQD